MIQVDYNSDQYLGGQIILDAQKGVGSLWLSGFHFAHDHQKLKKNKINAVLSAADLQHKYPEEITHLVFKLQDDEEQVISHVFQQAFSFIETQRKKTNVLVHCAAGISRSSTIVISYLMNKLNIKFNQAYSIVKKRRSYIQPNPGFVEQLKLYEKKLDGAKKAALPNNSLNKTSNPNSVKIPIVNNKNKAGQTKILSGKVMINNIPKTNNSIGVPKKIETIKLKKTQTDIPMIKKEIKKQVIKQQKKMIDKAIFTYFCYNSRIFQQDPNFLIGYIIF